MLATELLPGKMVKKIIFIWLLICYQSVQVSVGCADTTNLNNYSIALSGVCKQFFFGIYIRICILYD